MASLRILSGSGDLFDLPPCPPGTVEHVAGAVALMRAGDREKGRERIVAALMPLFPRNYRRPLLGLSCADAFTLGSALLREEFPGEVEGRERPAEGEEKYAPGELERAVARGAAALERFRNSGA